MGTPISQEAYAYPKISNPIKIIFQFTAFTVFGMLVND